MRKYALCLMLAAFVRPASLYSQNQDAIDSLTNVIRKSSGVDSYAAWHQLVAAYIDVDNEMALSLMDKVEEAPAQL